MGYPKLTREQRLFQPYTNHAGGQVNICVTSNHKIVNILLCISWNTLKQEKKLMYLLLTLNLNGNITAYNQQRSYQRKDETNLTLPQGSRRLLSRYLSTGTESWSIWPRKCNAWATTAHKTKHYMLQTLWPSYSGKSKTSTVTTKPKRGKTLQTDGLQTEQANLNTEAATFLTL